MADPLTRAGCVAEGDIIWTNEFCIVKLAIGRFNCVLNAVRNVEKPALSVAEFDEERNALVCA